MAATFQRGFLTLVLLGLTLVTGKILNSNDNVKYRDCEDLRSRGRYNLTGEYQIFINDSVASFPVVCKFLKAGSTVVFMQQKYGRISFMQPWATYKNGFGRASEGDFWIGLENIAHLTSRGYNRLTVTLQDWGNTLKTIHYTLFRVFPSYSRYELKIGGYQSSHILPDDLSQGDSRPFATMDVPDTRHCAHYLRAGWWYGNFRQCAFALPTGHRLPGPRGKGVGAYYTGMYYSDWHGFDYSLKYLRMDISNF